MCIFHVYGQLIELSNGELGVFCATVYLQVLRRLPPYASNHLRELLFGRPLIQTQTGNVSPSLFKKDISRNVVYILILWKILKFIQQHHDDDYRSAIIFQIFQLSHTSIIRFRKCSIRDAAHTLETNLLLQPSIAHRAASLSPTYSARSASNSEVCSCR